MTLNELLATVNATLTTASLVCLGFAWRAIRAEPRRVIAHRNLMLAATTFSAAFLVVFVWRFVMFGPTGYLPTSPIAIAVFRLVYFTHEPIAVVSVFLTIPTLIFGLRGRLRMHREIAPVALGIWTYSCVTGIAVWVLLYGIPMVRPVSYPAGHMSIRRIGPQEAEQLQSQGFMYVDVRTPQEFEMSRPKGAVNVPVMNLDPSGRMLPNPEFVAAFSKAFPQGSKFVVGCKAGNRSLRAAQLLNGAGYPEIVEQQGGFDGWTGAGLPVETGKK